MMVFKRATAADGVESTCGVRLLACIVAFVVLGMVVTHAARAGQNYAVVVGASEYPNLDERYSLVGPRYDAELVRDFLVGLDEREFPPDHIELLADGAEGGEAPTRDRVLAALDSTAERVQSGDFVYLHFSGHGTRAPARDPESELDGLDELFLAHDARGWSDAIGTVENSLADDEIGSRIASIRSKGAFVWAVIDSCHSGTATRGAAVGDEIRYRKVDPDALGIPLDEVATQESGQQTRGKGTREAEGSMDRGGDATSGQGGFVAFYAAQSTEQTPEMRLPAGEPGRQPHGLFTFTLFEVLSQHPGVTYRQASQEILQRYAADRRRPTPLFEGDLDARVFGTEETASVAQWPLERVESDVFRISAGTIHGLRTGDELIVVPSPAAASEDALGALRVRSVKAMESRLVPASGQAETMDEAGEWPEEAVVRRQSTRVSFELRVARPDYVGARDEARAGRVQAALDELVEREAQEGSGLRIEWVEAGEGADVRLAFPLVARDDDRQTVIDNDHLWLAPPNGAIEVEGDRKTPSIRLFTEGPSTPEELRTPEELATALARSLTSMARVTNLLRLGTAYGPSNSPLQVELRLKRKGNDEFQRFNTEDPPPTVQAGDEVHITAHNPGEQANPRPIDVNILFIGSDFSIQHMGNARVHPGDVLRKGLFRVTESSLGKEHVLVIASPGRKQTDVQDLAFLQQDAIPRTRGTRTKGESSPAFGSLLREAGFGETTRGAAPLGGSEEATEGSIRRFTVITQAATESSAP